MCGDCLCSTHSEESVMHNITGFISGGARGAFAPPYEGLCPPEKLVELTY